MFDGTEWLWLNGSIGIDTDAHFGDRGICSHDNNPSARASSMSAYDTITGDLLLFGGYGYDDGEQEGVVCHKITDIKFILKLQGILNDFWRWNSNGWCWIAGSNQTDVEGDYFSKQQNPGGRFASGMYFNNVKNHVVLFGGHSIDWKGEEGELMNDIYIHGEFARKHERSVDF
jgi:hypothetical protein